MEAKIVLSREKKYWCYGPGDRVEGKLVFQNSAPIYCSGICVSLETTVRVNFRDSDGRLRSHVENAMSPNVTAYVWPINWSWAQITGKLDDERQFLRASKHIFPFSFDYPMSPLPGTFCSEYGSVKHQLVAYMKTPTSAEFQRVATHILSFGDYFNLLQDAYSLKPLRFVKRKKSLMFLLMKTVASPLEFTLKMPQRGFLPGEYAPFTLTLTNLGGKPVSRIVLSLVQKVSYIATKCKKTLGTVLDETDTAEADCAAETIWESGVYVPHHIKPSYNRGAIQHQYFIKVQVFAKGSTATLKGHVPVMIGTAREPEGFRSCNNCRGGMSSLSRDSGRRRRRSMELPTGSWDPLFGSDSHSPSLVASPPPSYSQLSSRAASIDNFLPLYEDAMHSHKVNLDGASSAARERTQSVTTSDDKSKILDKPSPPSPTQEDPEEEPSASEEGVFPEEGAH